MLVIPPGLSQEEEALQKKFNELKKKKKALLALKTQSSSGTASQGGQKCSLPAQPVPDPATATEQAKQLVKSGAISAVEAETKNSGFRRSRALEGKFKDPEKGPLPTSQPLQGSLSADDHLQVVQTSPKDIAARELCACQCPASGPGARRGGGRGPGGW
uniref:Negative elongation factor complex member E n=1 Tax=Myotis myotis TaxID=51298 RepID=A0A7J7VIH5_MYOMY|nr:hypothetical protein mMyoMyo1_008276 [Myotis myotis]